jgi:hypothetical protein
VKLGGAAAEAEAPGEAMDIDAQTGSQLQQQQQPSGGAQGGAAPDDSQQPSTAKPADDTAAVHQQGSPAADGKAKEAATSAVAAAAAPSGSHPSASAASGGAAANAPKDATAALSSVSQKQQRALSKHASGGLTRGTGRTLGTALNHQGRCHNIHAASPGQNMRELFRIHVGPCKCFPLPGGICVLIICSVVCSIAACLARPAPLLVHS